MPLPQVLKVNLPVKYSQFDSLWAKKLLGFNTDPKYDFYNFGCLVSSLANVCKYFGYEENPSTLDDKLKAVSGYVENTGIYKSGSLTKIYPDIKEQWVETPERLTDEQMAEIRNALDLGFPVLVKIDYDPKTVKVDDHFSLLVDYDSKDENNFILADTLGGVLRPMRNYLGWIKPSVRNTIEKYMIYRKDGFSPVSVGSPVVPVVSVEKVSESGLPENYPDIIHKSSQWDYAVQKYGVGKSPEQTHFVEMDAEIQKKLSEASSSANTGEEKIVVSDSHAGTQWAELVGYLELGKLPSEAVFEDAKRVIAGLKSAKTDYDNKRIEAEKVAAQNEILIKNKEMEISNLEKKVIRMEKLHKAEVDALIKAQPNLSKLKTQYEAEVKNLQADLEVAIKEVGTLKIDVSNRQIEAGESPKIVIKASDPVGVIGETLEDVVGDIIERLFSRFGGVSKDSKK